MNNGQEKKPYHHGNLHETLMEDGLTMIHEDGLANFSLRKLAKRVGVSATAIYNHFDGLEDLMTAMNDYVARRFYEALYERVVNSQDQPYRITTEVGKGYVKFFSEHPNYFSFVFDQSNTKVKIEENDIKSNYPAFALFREVSLQCFHDAGIKEEAYRDNLLVMWACVHGLAAMANMKTVTFDGDWEELTEKVLVGKLNIR